MRVKRVAEYWEKIEKESGRLVITEILAELFTEVDPNEIKYVCYLSLGQLAPFYEMVEFGIAEKMVLRAISQAYDVPLELANHSYKNIGDLGDVVYELSKKTEQVHDSGLSITNVYQDLVVIARASGPGSQERKIQGLVDLFRKLDSVSAKFVARIPVGKLRLGFGEMTILDSLSWMISGGKVLRPALEDAYNLAADVGALAEKVKSSADGVDSIQLELEETSVQLGTPLVAALCQRLKSFDEIIEKMGTVACEPKYDGTRLQIHFRRNGTGGTEIRNQELNQVETEQKGQQALLAELTAEQSQKALSEEWIIKTFTRNLEENSSMFPELNTIGDQLTVDEVVLDAEAVGIDPVTGNWLPFQMTMTRKRKHGVSDQQEKVPLKFMVFDVMYVKYSETTEVPKRENREGDVHKLPLSERKKILEQIIKPGELLEIVPVKVTDQAQECRALHHEYLEDGLEGVIVKKWDSMYVPGRKGWNWVKMKERETARAGLADTVDCVVMGYYGGRGKRADFGLGAFLVGVRGKDLKNNYGDFNENNMYTISKIGTGLSDEQFRSLWQRLEALRINEKPDNYLVNKNLAPDVWVKPELVVEIAADNLTKSPIHTMGLALRFPRLVKFRDDKSADEASTVDEVLRLYELQK